MLKLGVFAVALLTATAAMGAPRINRSAIIAAARVLAGGELDEDEDNLHSVAARLVARGVVADKACLLKDQTAIALWIADELLVPLKNSERDKNLLGVAGLFVADDFKTLGKKEWCIDYMARATAANALYASSKNAR